MFGNLWFYYFAVFFCAMLVSLFCTPAFINIAQRYRIVDKPGPRRVNVKVTARFGGPAMFLGFAVASAFVMRRIPEWPAVITGAGLMAFIGGFDDVRGLPAPVKLAGQILVAALVTALGVRVDFVTNPFDKSMFFLPNWLTFTITIFWIVGITNTVNLIDGLDGLAAGIVCIASFTFFLVADFRGQESSAMLSLALMGSTVGFLRWNFFPSKTFMGDAGAYFLGFMVSVIAVGGTFKSTTAVTFLIPVLALGVPIFDTTFAILRRLRKGGSVMSAPDKGHVHHRLLRMVEKGRSEFVHAGEEDGPKFLLWLLQWRPHRTVVILVYVITLCLSVVSLLLIRAYPYAIALLVGIILLVPLMIITGKLVKGRRHAKNKSM